MTSSATIPTFTDVELFKFHCAQPNFTICSVPAKRTFLVNKEKMAEGSQIFRDMFGMCDEPNAVPVSGAQSPPQTLDIYEDHITLGLFLALLHEETVAGTPQPSDPVARIDDVPIAGRPSEESTSRLPTRLPLETLKALIDLADKYDIAPHLNSILRERLSEITPDYPLEVYAMANLMDFTAIAAHASSFLLDRPLDSYTHEEAARYFPSIRAYHRLTKLHGCRRRMLREVLVNEELFPHGYGKCSKHHAQAEKMWGDRKFGILEQIAPGTDVASAMSELKAGPSFNNCDACGKALVGALGMLKYKLDKVPYTFLKVPGGI